MPCIIIYIVLYSSSQICSIKRMFTATNIKKLIYSLSLNKNQWYIICFKITISRFKTYLFNFNLFSYISFQNTGSGILNFYLTYYAYY